MNTIQAGKYKEWVRTLPCIICLMLSEGRTDLQNSASDPHHVNEEGIGTMAGKTSDSRVIPLCRAHHQEYHNRGRWTFSEKYNVDLEDIISRLNEIWRERDEYLQRKYPK